MTSVTDWLYQYAQTVAGSEFSFSPVPRILYPLSVVTGEEHNKYLAWTFLGHSAFQLFILLLSLVFFGFVFSAVPPGRGAPPEAFFWWMFAFMFIVQSIFIVPSLIAAWALLKHKPWARLASIIAAVIAAFNMPVGTAACVYSMWFFFSDKWKEVYTNETKVDENERRQLVADLQTRWSGMRTDETGEVTFHHVEPPDWR